MFCFVQIATLVTLARNDVAFAQCPALLPQMVTQSVANDLTSVIER